jgi:hypothetical protein
MLAVSNELAGTSFSHLRRDRPVSFLRR